MSDFWQADIFRKPVNNNHFIKGLLLTVFLYNDHLSITDHVLVAPKVAVTYRFDCINYENPTNT